MDFDANIGYLKLAFWNVVLTAGPVLGVALAVGLLIGIVQAATSINEMTLSFVPKLVIVLGAMAFLSGYMLTQMSDYFAFVFGEIVAIQ